MSKFYTSVSLVKDKILLRGFENGKRIQRAFTYKPFFYVLGKDKDSDYKSIDGRSLARMDFPNVWEARKFYQKYKDVSGFEIFGIDKFHYAFIQEEYPEEIEYDTALINWAVIDIETKIDGSFPDIQLANKQITAITLQHRGRSISFGYVDFVPPNDSITYIKCRDEKELLHKFLTAWNHLDLDAVTGWNIEGFDIPYLVNRIAVVLGEEEARRLSPFNLLQQKEVTIMNKEITSYMPVGIAVLDYLQLYKKFASQRAGQDSFKESFKLDYIANKELKEAKLDYSEYDNLDDLYEKNPQKFFEYNIHDCTLVTRLEETLRYIELIFAMAYDAHVNYNDAFTTVSFWDAIIYNYLMNKKIVIPKHTQKYAREIAGGFVKESLVGMHEWIVSFDLTSLYPSLIMGLNISPETYVTKVHEHNNDELLEIFWNGNNINTRDLSVAANGLAYRKDVQGFLGALMQKKSEQRAVAKKKKLKAEELYEETHEEKYLNEKIKYDGIQLAIKIASNSLYGALSNVGFRFYNADQAESITLTGQLAIRWVERKMNAFLNNMLGTTGVDYVVHVDTDSVLVRMDAVVKAAYGSSVPEKNKVIDFLDSFAKQKVTKEIEKWYNELASKLNLYKNTLEMKREIIADKAIWVAKKRYIANVWDLEGVRYEKPKFKIKGIEAVRSSTPEICRKKIEETVRVIMETDEEKTREFINKFREEFKQCPFEMIASPRGVNGLDKYADSTTIYKKGTPIQVRAVLLHNHLVKKLGLTGKIQQIYEGEKIRYSYLKMPNPLREDVIACADTLPKEFGLDEYIDYDTQFEKSFLEPIKGIMEVIGWSYERKATLSAFFQ